MFGLSIEKLLVLAMAALFILCPERLPAAAGWLGRVVRQVKDFTSDAQNQVRSQLGPESDQLRQPLHDLRSDLSELQALCDPRRTLTHYTTAFEDDTTEPEHDVTRPTPHWQPTSRQAQRPLSSGERPPLDPDAT